jgi:cytoskeletal protein CcmA (bactofilin family)
MRSKVITVLLAILCLLLVAMPAAADESKAISVIGSDYVVEAGTIFNNDLVVVAGNLTLAPNSQVNGQVAVTGGNVVIAGTLNGSLVVIGGTTHLESSAVVNGDIISPGTVDLATGAAVNGRVVSGLGATTDPLFTNRLLNLGIENWDQGLTRFAKFLLRIFVAALFIALTVVVDLLWSARVSVIGEAMRKSWLASLGAGLLTLIVFVVLVPILVVICIGIPVALVLAVGLMASVVIGGAAIARIIGNYILRLLKVTGSGTVHVLVGAAIVALLSLVPCIGVFVFILGGGIAVGATVLTRLGSRDYPLPTLPVN